MESYKIITKNPLCFQIENPEDRLDCNFNNPELIKFDKWIEKQSNSVLISKICDITDGSHEVRTYVDDGILFLRIINIKEDGLDLSNVKYISEKEHKEYLKRSSLEENDVLLTKTGTLGVTFVVPKDLGEANISADLGVLKIKKEYKQDALPEFLSIFLSSDFALKQIYKNISGSSRDRIVLKNIKKIKILLPDVTKQEILIKKFNELKKEAEEDLNSFNDKINKIKKYLNSKINLNLDNQTNIFIVKKERIKDRLDCYFYVPEFKFLLSELKKINNGNLKIIEAKDLDLNKPIQKEEFDELKNHVFKYLDIGNTDKDLGEIADFEEEVLMNLPTRAKQKANTNDILVPRPIGSTSTIVKIDKEFDKQFYSTGFIGIKNKSEQEALLLKAVLMSDIVQKQFFYLQSGSLQPEITPTNFREYVLIPCPIGNLKINMLNEIEELFKESKKDIENYRNKKQKAKELFLQELLK